MQRFEVMTDKLSDLVGQVGDRLHHVPDAAGRWLQTGVAIGAAKTGARVAGGFVRRHPTALAAAAIGAGVLWLVVRRHARKQAQAAAQGQDPTQVIEGQARRVPAKRGNRSRARSSAGAAQAQAE